jgi:hypothetical protein
MALTRKLLAALGIEAEKIEEIISAHTETVDALKNERDQYKADAEKLPEVQKKLNEAEQAVKTYEDEGGKDRWKVKYDAVKEEYDNYKNQIEAEKIVVQKKDLFRQVLKDINISEKRIDAVLRVSDVENLELDEKGQIKDVDNLKESLKQEWSDFIVTESKKGADENKPPKDENQNAFEAMTLTEKMTYANQHPTDPQVINWLK